MKRSKQSFNKWVTLKDFLFSAPSHGSLQSFASVIPCEWSRQRDTWAALWRSYPQCSQVILAAWIRLPAEQLPREVWALWKVGICLQLQYSAKSEARSWTEEGQRSASGCCRPPAVSSKRGPQERWLSGGSEGCSGSEHGGAWGSHGSLIWPEKAVAVFVLISTFRLPRFHHERKLGPLLFLFFFFSRTQCINFTNGFVWIYIVHMLQRALSHNCSRSPSQYLVFHNVDGFRGNAYAGQTRNLRLQCQRRKAWILRKSLGDSSTEEK